MFYKSTAMVLALLIASPVAALNQAAKSSHVAQSKSSLQNIVPVTTRALFVWGGSAEWTCLGCRFDDRDK